MDEDAARLLAGSNGNPDVVQQRMRDGAPGWRPPNLLGLHSCQALAACAGCTEHSCCMSGLG